MVRLLRRSMGGERRDRARVICGQAEQVKAGRPMKYTEADLTSIRMLDHILARPKMYFTDSLELAAFCNGWMTHRSGFMRGSFVNSCFGCRADPIKTLEENAEVFKAVILEWEKNKSNEWRCCIDAK